jgi:ATP-binding cassette subfamily B protein
MVHGSGDFGTGNYRRSLGYLESGKPDARRTLGRVWRMVRPYRLRLLLGILLVVLGVGASLVPPLLIQALLNVAIPQRNVRLVILLGIGMFLFPGGAATINLGQNLVSAMLSQSLIADLRKSLYEHIQKLGLDFFTSTRAGEIHTRFTNDAGNLPNVLTQSILGTMANLVTLVFAIVVMASLNWKLTIVACLALPALAFPVLHFGKQRYGAADRAQRALGELSVVLEETLSLSGAIVVKSFGTEAQEARRFGEVNERVRTSQVEQTLVGQWSSVVVQALAALGPAVLYSYGAYLVITQQVRIGTVVAFAAYLTQLYRPAASLAGTNTTLLGGLALFDRVFQFLDLPIAVAESRQPTLLPPSPRDGIAFEHVSFSYPNSKLGPQPVLYDVSFVAPVGSLTALVGPSGAGKSTILSLAARFYDPTQGRIRLDGVDLRQVAFPDLRSRLAIVTQEVFLFHSTLRSNLRYGAESVSDDDVNAVIEAAQLRELVDRLSEGLDTVVGERGYRLSGGEKQRVAIARALLQRAPYLLLDEATSSLDSQAERLIQLALDRLLQGRTVIAIAHRLSTIQRANQILVINGGRIVEQGTHDSLLQQSGLYRRLYEAQFVTEGSAEGILAAPVVQTR